MLPAQALQTCRRVTFTQLHLVGAFVKAGTTGTADLQESDNHAAAMSCLEPMLSLQTSVAMTPHNTIRSMCSALEVSACWQLTQNLAKELESGCYARQVTWSLRKLTMDLFRASSSSVSHTRDMRWQSMDSNPLHTPMKSCEACTQHISH